MANSNWGTQTIPFYYDAAGNRIATFGLSGPGAFSFNLDTGERYYTPQPQMVSK